MPSAIAEAALVYAGNGWNVLPLYGITRGVCDCRTKCGSPGKHPIPANGLKAATTDRDVISDWWRRYPNANVGIRTGAVSGLYVIDVDNKRSVDIGAGVLVGEGDHSVRVWEMDHDELPPTLVAESGGGGLHLVYAYPGDLLDDRQGPVKGWLPGVDIRADDAYIVAAPSVHASGNVYRWVDGVERPSPCPPSVVELVASHTPADAGRADPTDDQPITEGRNNYLFERGQHLWQVSRLSETELVGALLALNLRFCNPPLDQPEVESIVRSIVRNVAQNAEISLGRGEITFEPVSEPVEIEEGADLAPNFNEWVSQPLVDLPRLVDGILHVGEGAILAGRPNLGKTWFTLDLAISVATGLPFLNHFQTSSGPVLLIDEEGSDLAIRRRFVKLLAGREIQDFSRMKITPVIGRGIRLDSKEGLVTVRRLLERYRPRLVIFDSLVRLASGNENDNREMSNFFGVAKSLLTYYECSFLFTHHIRKPGKDQTPDDLFWSLRGASDIQGWPDSILMAQRPVGSHGLVEVHHTKMREGSTLDAFGVSMDITPETAALRYTGPLEGEKPAVVQLRERIMEYIDSLAPEKPTSGSIAIALGEAGRKVQQELDTIYHAGDIEKILDHRTGLHVFGRKPRRDTVIQQAWLDAE